MLSLSDMTCDQWTGALLGLADQPWPHDHLAPHTKLPLVGILCPRVSGALSLVQINPDTFLSLVEHYYAITTHLKASKIPPKVICTFQCVSMA